MIFEISVLIVFFSVLIPYLIFIKPVVTHDMLPPKPIPLYVPNKTKPQWIKVQILKYQIYKQFIVQDRNQKEYTVSVENKNYTDDTLDEIVAQHFLKNWACYYQRNSIEIIFTFIKT